MKRERLKATGPIVSQPWSKTSMFVLQVLAGVSGYIGFKAVEYVFQTYEFWLSGVFVFGSFVVLFNLFWIYETVRKRPEIDGAGIHYGATTILWDDITHLDREPGSRALTMNVGGTRQQMLFESRTLALEALERMVYFQRRGSGSVEDVPDALRATQRSGSGPHEA